jgi:starch-binding outer membrane protein, SusD/RagB family
MKKNIHPIIHFVLFIILVISGCKKELESKIFDQLSPTNFPQNEADIKTALTSFYTMFTTDWGAVDPGSGVYDFAFNPAYLGYDWETRIMTDQAFDNWWSSWSMYTFGPSTQLSNDGACFYNRIRFVARATDIIDKISKAPVTDQVKEKYLGEAKALRAWYMFILYDLYGPLNPKLDPAKLTNLTIEPRLTNEAYVDTMANDLNQAIAVLPDKYNGTSDWGRVSKGVARMILLKIYMQNKQWDKAKTIGTDLMDMGYSLLPNYKDVFINPGNNELIYAVPGNSGMNQYWYDMEFPGDIKRIYNQDVTPGWWQGDGMPWSYYDKYDPSDTRLETIGSYYINTSGDTIGRNNGLNLAIPMKYTKYTANQQGFELVMYRYADVLLSMAEIENELNNGPTATAIGYAKQVTDRANTIIPASATIDKGSFNDFLLDERGRELYYEFGIRRQDLIRHGKLISYAQARGITAAKDYMVLLPIPQDVISESKGVVAQNPGY